MRPNDYLADALEAAAPSDRFSVADLRALARDIRTAPGLISLRIRVDGQANSVPPDIALKAIETAMDDLDRWADEDEPRGRPPRLRGGGRKAESGRLKPKAVQIS